jgi:hypothetical protein
LVEESEKTTDNMPHVTDKLYHVKLHRVRFPMCYHLLEWSLGTHVNVHRLDSAHRVAQHVLKWWIGCTLSMMLSGYNTESMAVNRSG